jgi:hypothetical protein
VKTSSYRTKDPKKKRACEACGKIYAPAYKRADTSRWCSRECRYPGGPGVFVTDRFRGALAISGYKKRFLASKVGLAEAVFCRVTTKRQKVTSILRPRFVEVARMIGFSQDDLFDE